MMTTSIQELDGRLVATLSGELDTAAALETEKVLQPLLACEGKDIVFDCTSLEYISSSGLRILLSILKQAQSVGSRVVLKNVNDVVRDVLDLTGFVSIFEFE
jgi:anti-anti-sigma factor